MLLSAVETGKLHYYLIRTSWLYGPWGPKTRTVASNETRGEFAPIEALTVDQVNAAIRTYFKPDALSVFLAGDFAGKAGAAATAAPTK